VGQLLSFEVLASPAVPFVGSAASLSRCCQSVQVLPVCPGAASLSVGGVFHVIRVIIRAFVQNECFTVKQLRLHQHGSLPWALLGIGDAEIAGRVMLNFSVGVL